MIIQKGRRRICVGRRYALASCYEVSTIYLHERDPPVLEEPAAHPPSDHGCAAGPEQTPAPAHATRRQPGLNRAAWTAAVGMQDKMNEREKWQTTGVVSE